MTPLGRFLREARKARANTLSDLACRAAIDVSQISKIERGVNANPRVETLVKIADALGVDVGEVAEIAAQSIRRGSGLGAWKRAKKAARRAHRRRSIAEKG